MVVVVIQDRICCCLRERRVTMTALSIKSPLKCDARRAAITLADDNVSVVVTDVAKL